MVNPILDSTGSGLTEATRHSYAPWMLEAYRLPSTLGQATVNPGR